MSLPVDTNNRQGQPRQHQPREHGTETMTSSLGFTLGINGAAGNTLYWKFSFDHQRHVVFCTHNREELFMGETMEQARHELGEMIDRLMAAR